MKFITMIFAILAAVPQALRWIAYGFARMNDCTPGGPTCEIGGENQAHILNMIYQPNWFTTTGLWIGGAGTLVGFAIMYGLQFYRNRETDEMIDNIRERRSNERNRQRGGHLPRPSYGQRDDRRSDPRDDRYYDDRPRGRGRRDDYDDYDPDARHQQGYRRPRGRDDDRY